MVRVTLPNTLIVVVATFSKRIEANHFHNAVLKWLKLQYLCTKIDRQYTGGQNAIFIVKV